MNFGLSLCLAYNLPSIILFVTTPAGNPLRRGRTHAHRRKSGCATKRQPLAPIPLKPVLTVCCVAPPSILCALCACMRS